MSQLRQYNKKPCKTISLPVGHTHFECDRVAKALALPADVDEDMEDSESESAVEDMEDSESDVDLTVAVDPKEDLGN